jgi:antitoxin FitA
MMPTTITLKGIPDDVYDRLKLSADANRRSLNSEVIACLETLMLPKKTTAIQHLAAVRALRATLPKAAFKHAEIDRLKREGRA